MYLIYVFRDIIEYFYVKYNQPSIIFKRDFNELSYSEKIFLAFFHRDNLFNNSIANIYKNNDLLNFRKDKFPLIFFFHLYFDKSDYKFTDLKNITKHYKYFVNSKIFKNTLIRLKNLFFKKYTNSSSDFFIIFLIIQNTFFKRYYNLCSSIYFKNTHKNNLVKLNWMFYLFLNSSTKLLKVYDLSKYSDWYDYNFKHKTSKKIFHKKFVRGAKKINKLKTDFQKKNKEYIYKTYKTYNLFFKAFVKNYENINISILKFDPELFNKIKINVKNNWFSKIKLFYPTRFSESSMSKHIELNNINNYTFFFIRKNRIFNKGRYSRNRQLYRTGVYWCLWLNIMLVYGLYFMFYRFTFNFGYFWWGLLILMYSTIFSRVAKYNFFNVFYVKNEFIAFFNWFGLILLNIRNLITSILGSFIKNTYIFNFYFSNNFLLNYINTNMLHFLTNLRNLFIFKDSGKFVYFWESMIEKDESFLRHKSIVHWFTQLYKLLTF